MEKDSPTNKHNSNQEARQLFKGLTAAVIGLSVVFLILLGSVVFIALYDGSSQATEEAAIGDSSTDGTQMASAELVDGKDAVTELVIGEGFEIVRANCTGCHSSDIILQNRFTREGWKAKIIWMQETQGLWDLGENEPLILDYLAKHYAPEAPKGRRIPLKDIEWYELKD
jgi:hypothetical protein